MSASPKDRFLALLGSSSLNGIDFVELSSTNPLLLLVHFINTAPVGEPNISATITGGDRIPAVTVNPIASTDWGADEDGRPLLSLTVVAIGDRSNYTLTINSSKLDPFFNQTQFSFYALCPSDFDCATAPPSCPPDDTPLPPIDYLAKDFLSFQRALSDFSAQRYPDWVERSEADFGMMFLEALAGVADDLSYYQDRVAAEATLPTATARRSIVKLARLVDYEPAPQTSATTQLVCNVVTGPLPAGVLVNAVGPDGALIPFEIGAGLSDTSSYVVNPRWNGPIAPYWLDDSTRCLPPGATQMYVTGQGFSFRLGMAILLDTAAANTADPPTREIVHIESVQELTDDLFGPTPITLIAWQSAEALQLEHDQTRTSVYGNIVPATQGRRMNESFAIDVAPTGSTNLPLAIDRNGANSTPGKPAWDYLYSLRNAPLAWLAQSDAQSGGLPSALPEIQLTRQLPSVQSWSWTSSILQAEEFEPAFTTEPATWLPIATDPDGTVHYDYDNDLGDTIRFGNGIFGDAPNTGDVYEVRYRTTEGAAGNVAADTINVVDPAWTGLLLTTFNPFPASGGADRETNQQVLRRAPRAFKARQFRAVRAEDYQAAAEELPWVEQAGTAFRWTGSWLTVFTAVDPKGGLPPSFDEQVELINLLNRRRLAGYESYAPAPDYVSIDLKITVCALPSSFAGDVEEAVINTLRPPSGGASAFFFADHFTFGTPLERSRLEAAIQRAPGVAGVLSIRYRRRGFVPNFIGLPSELKFGVDQILRIDNDPSFPERGSIQVVVKGGR